MGKEGLTRQFEDFFGIENFEIHIPGMRSLPRAKILNAGQS